jgi:hypothetical protein
MIRWRDTFLLGWNHAVKATLVLVLSFFVCFAFGDGFVQEFQATGEKVEKLSSVCESFRKCSLITQKLTSFYRQNGLVIFLCVIRK